MRGYPRSLPGGAAPVDPRSRSKMSVQSAFIKFRIEPAQKERLATFARETDTPLSMVVRRAALAVADGRPVVRNVRIDLVAIRMAANELVAAVDATAADPNAAMPRIRAAAAELHRLAARQLAGIR